ncbi:MAG: hypothetical protein IPI49_16060 [Myxococcales bacterium]|nr:hypothetical protein [Myxococcales bacterium]
MSAAPISTTATGARYATSSGGRKVRRCWRRAPAKELEQRRDEEQRTRAEHDGGAREPALGGAAGGGASQQLLAGDLIRSARDGELARERLCEGPVARVGRGAGQAAQRQLGLGAAGEARHHQPVAAHGLDQISARIDRWIGAGDGAAAPHQLRAPQQDLGGAAPGARGQLIRAAQRLSQRQAI